MSKMVAGLIGQVGNVRIHLGNKPETDHVQIHRLLDSVVLVVGMIGKLKTVT